MFGRMVKNWGTDIMHTYVRHNGKYCGNDTIFLSLEHKQPPPQVQLTEELHLSGLIGMASHLDTQKIPIIRFIFENRLHRSSKFGCVPAFKPSGHA